MGGLARRYSPARGQFCSPGISFTTSRWWTESRRTHLVGDGFRFLLGLARMALPRRVPARREHRLVGCAFSRARGRASGSGAAHRQLSWILNESVRLTGSSRSSCGSGAHRGRDSS
jgi:hypothetical protein